MKGQNETEQWAEVNTKLTPGIGPVHLGREESPQPLLVHPPLWLLLLLALSYYQGEIKKPAWDQPWESSSRRWRGLYKTPRFGVKLMISCQNTKRQKMEDGWGRSRREKEQDKEQMKGGRDRRREWCCIRRRGTHSVLHRPILVRFTVK